MAIMKNGDLTEITENGKILLSIYCESDDERVVLKPVGAIKTPVAAGFRDVIMERLENNASVVIDMAEADYIASAGIRALLTAQKYVEDSDGMAEMVIKNVNDEVMDVFETTGFDRILSFEK